MFRCAPHGRLNRNVRRVFALGPNRLKRSYKFRIAGAILLAAFLGFAYLNKGWGPSEIILGTVTHVGMQYAVKNELPYPVVTVESKHGNTFLLKLPAEQRVAAGDTLEVLKAKRPFTSGYEFTFVRLRN